MKLPKPTQSCPCESSQQYANCCKLLHQGTPASSAERLLRSRYSAYTLLLEDYLLNTWHPDTRPASLDFDSDINRKWLGLTIKRSESTGETTATVEFIARYKDGGNKAERLHEISRFVQLKGRWYYLDGDFVS